MKLRKKLIEVALPLEVINEASTRDKLIRHGHPSAMHLWWARSPLATARAVIFAQMVNDPSSREDLSALEQDQERQRLFDIIEQLVKWENTTNEDVLETAREEIRKSWRRTCDDNRDHPKAAELFDPDKLPAFHDPFAGGGAIPLEAQRLGLEAHASDLNPVAVLINKAMIEIPPKFVNRPPVNPESRKGKGSTDAIWKGAAGLAEDVRYYGKWMRDEAEKRIGHLYPKIEVTPQMAQERPDLKPYEGRKLTVIAWLWARTVKSPNPAFADVDVPLASTFVLSTKKNKGAYVEPVMEDGGYRFSVKAGKPPGSAKNGTKLARGANFQCMMSKVPIAGDYIKTEGKAGRMGAKLIAIVADGDRGRVYLTPTQEHEAIVHHAEPTWMPDVEIPPDRRSMFTPLYGLTHFKHLFTDRQLVALTTFSDLVAEARERVKHDAGATGMWDDGASLRNGGAGATGYAEAVTVYLAFLTDQLANHQSTICGWHVNNNQLRNTFGRPAIPMTWDYAESNPFSESSGSFNNLWERQVKSFASVGSEIEGKSYQLNAAGGEIVRDTVLSTDPPYYDNIGYADLSDFFYVWLRRSLKPVFPDLFATLTVPKMEELVANPFRHGSKSDAEAFFLEGMTQTMQHVSERTHPGFPVTIYYAFKQAESKEGTRTGSTGWEVFLEALIQSGFTVTGTWPISMVMRTRQIAMGTNALSTYIVLVCRKRTLDAAPATRQEFVAVLRAELPDALSKLQRGNVAPVDLAQAAIGPGMAVFTRYEKVLDASGEPVSVREALALINQTLDEVLAEQEGDFDADTRWALAWYEQAGFVEGDFGIAETLSKAKNTSVTGMVDADFLTSGRGKVRLLTPAELSADWDPDKYGDFTVWEATHHLIRLLGQGEPVAAEALAKMSSRAEAARDLAYRLYRMCDQKGRSQDALMYNGLVQSWPEIARLAGEQRSTQQASLIN